MAPVLVTREYITKLLTPLIGQRDDRNARRKLHLTANITRGGQTRVDADICAISDKGITDCFFNKLELLRWEDIRSVQLVLRDHLDNIECEGDVLKLDHRALKVAA